jgi:hypothetical protein
MAYPNDRGELLVSLQARTAGGNALSDHIALGALLGPDQAVFDLVAGFTVPRDRELEILISPTAPGPGDMIERIRPRQVVIRSLDTTPDAMAALVPLAHDSRYGAAVARMSLEDLQAAVEQAGEIWPAMINIGWIKRPLRDLNPTETLARIADVERIKLNRLVRPPLVISPGQIAGCFISNDTECSRSGFLLGQA